jgi:hypothetical protein
VATCEICRNEYDKTFEVRDEKHVFDSFEWRSTPSLPSAITAAAA